MTKHLQSKPHDKPAPPGTPLTPGTHEADDIWIGSLAMGWLTVVVCIGLCLAGSGLLVMWFNGSHPAPDITRLAPTSLPEPVQNWTTPGSQLVTEEQGWHDHLDHYRWIDRDKHIVAIPIEQAMKILASQSQQQSQQQSSVSPQGSSEKVSQ